MPRRSFDYLDELAKLWEPRLRRSFLDGVRQRADAVNITALSRLIERGDVEGALRAVGIDPGDFSQVALDLARIYAEGGIRTAERIPTRVGEDGYRLRTTFNARAPLAERWVTERSSLLIGGIDDNEREMVRAYLRRGLERGVNPKTMALDLVGRRAKQDVRVGKTIIARKGERVGGVIGLHPNQEQWVARYVDDLSSSDPAALRRLLDRGLRDRRFDSSVRKAIEEGRGLSAEIQAKMRVAYTNRALRWRGRNIARTEVMRALGAGQREAYRQAIDKGAIEKAAIRRFWVTAGDEDVRDTHRQIPLMNKDGVGWDEPFQTPDGPVMHAPHDRDPMCRCRERIDVDFLAPAVRALRQARRRAGGGVPPTPTPAVTAPRFNSFDIDDNALGAAEFMRLFRTREEGQVFAQRILSGLPADEPLDVSVVQSGLKVSVWGASKSGNVRVIRHFEPDEIVGESVRGIVATHENFELAKKYQGGGYARNLLRSATEEYRRIGVTKINLHADMDVGGYAWARYGFRPRNQSTRQLRGDLRLRLGKSQLSDQDKTILGTIIDTSADGDLMYRLATARNAAGERIGRPILLGSDWYGTLDLNDPSALGRLLTELG